jgi:hypothetical protein
MVILSHLPTNVNKVSKKSINKGLGKKFTFLSKIIAILFALFASLYYIYNMGFSKDIAIAIILVASFIASTGFPVDISKIIVNSKKNVNE